MSKARRSPPLSARAEEGRGDCPGGRAGLEHLHGSPLRLGDVSQAAAREHEEQRRRDFRLGELSRHATEILVGQRLDVRVRDRRRRPLELADLGRDLVGRGREDLRVTRGDEPHRLGLVARVRVGVEEHDRDRAHTARGEALDGGRELVAVERPANRAVGAHALGDFQAPMARHQRLGLGDVEVVELELPLPPDLERVAEAGRRDEAGDGALALDERVGEERRRVHDAGEMSRLERAVAQDRADAGRRPREPDRRGSSAPCGSTAGRCRGRTPRRR